MLLVQKEDMSSSIPQRHSEEAAGCDIYTIDGGTINPNESSFVHTGIILRAKPNTIGIVFGRSGLSNKYCLEIESKLIHSESKDEVVIHVINNGDVPYHYTKNERIAQVVFVESGCEIQGC